MSIQLKNNQIKVEIVTSGAELVSMKRTGDDTEYIWNADPAYWKRHAPVLFPIVGKVVNDQYRYKGKTYHLGQHGFARDMVFDVVSQNDKQVILGLKWNSKTLDLYPFRFEFFVSYQIEESRLTIEYKVNNLDDHPIYFSVGAHPGFNCPLGKDEAFDDYYFEFEQEEETSITPLTKDGLLQRETKPYLAHENIIKLNDVVFEDDALVFDHLKSKRISLKSKKSDYCIHVDFDGFPFLGLWSKPTGAPFVCIEPWIGHADYFDFTKEFTEKEDQICLDVLKSFACQFAITI